jgi:hypothetical protein
MNCEWVKENATLFVYGELADDAQHEFEHHVARCAGCGAELETVRAFHQVMSARPLLEPSPNLLAAARMRLQEALEITQQVGAWRRWIMEPAMWFRQVRFQPALAAALLMVGFTGGILMGFARNNGGGSPIAKNRAVQDVSEATVAGIRGIVRDPDTNKVQINYDTVQRDSVEGDLSDPRIQELLLFAAQNNNNSGLRMDSVNLLTQQAEGNRVREALIYALRYDTNPGVRLRALEGLQPYVKDDVRVRNAVLEALLNDGNPGVRTQAINMLEVVKADGSVRNVLSELAQKDPNQYIRQQSGRLLASVPELK